MNKQEKDYPPIQLCGDILLTAKISCSICPTIGCVTVEDSNQAIEYFYNEGWRSTKSYVYCPVHARKYKRPNFPKPPHKKPLLRKNKTP